MNIPLFPRSIRICIGRIPLAVLTAFIWIPAVLHAAPRQALWHVVHNLCVTDRRLTGHATPCLEVNLADGYAVVPDPKKPAHLLLVPTQWIKGIEDPRLIGSATPNYWQQAWAARHRLAARVGRELPRDEIGLAINAISGRSQDQLHIHISCVQPEVADTLKALRPRLGVKWSVQTILGRQWQVRTWKGENLGGLNPFRLVADSSDSAATNMGQQTIIVVGAQWPSGPGFYLLTRSTGADFGDQGSAEGMLDESCSTAAHTG